MDFLSDGQNVGSPAKSALFLGYLSKTPEERLSRYPVKASSFTSIGREQEHRCCRLCSARSAAPIKDCLIQSFLIVFQRSMTDFMLPCKP